MTRSRQKAKSCLNPITSRYRSSMFKEVMGVVNRHNELSVPDRVFILGIARHKLQEGDK